jgi:hypothetical protein
MQKEKNRKGKVKFIVLTIDIVTHLCLAGKKLFAQGMM